MFDDMCRYNVSDDDCDKCLKHKGCVCPLPCPDYECAYGKDDEDEKDDQYKR